MGFIIKNERDRLVIKPTLFAGLLKQKLIINKKYLKKRTKLIDLRNNKEYSIEFVDEEEK